MDVAIFSLRLLIKQAIRGRVESTILPVPLLLMASRDKRSIYEEDIDISLRFGKTAMPMLSSSLWIPLVGKKVIRRVSPNTNRDHFQEPLRPSVNSKRSHSRFRDHSPRSSTIRTRIISSSVDSLLF